MRGGCCQSLVSPLCAPMRNPKRQAPDSNGESAPYIPTELMRLVMARLPVKSLCRFKCVSPLWNSIISDPQFEELQFDSSRPSLLISAYNRDYEFALFSHRVSVVRLPLPPPQPLLKYQSMQSVGGLILDGSKESTLRIYNPSTGELSGDISIPENVEGCMEFSSSMFGYDPIERTHKILGMWIQWIDDRSNKTSYRVLTLDKQMKWRSLAGGDCHEPFFAKTPELCLDGVVYCFGLQTNADDNSTCCFFVRFDVKSEVLRWVRVPQAIDADPFSSKIIGFNGSVALYCPWDDTNDEIILWLFQGCDEQRDPWRRITIAKHSQWNQVKVVIGTVPSGELLFWDSERYKDSVFPITLFYYNIDSKIIRTESLLPDSAETEFFLTSSASESNLSTLYECNHALVTNHVESIKSLKYISN